MLPLFIFQKSKVLQTAASWESEGERIKTAWEAVTGRDELDDLDWAWLTFIVA